MNVGRLIDRFIPAKTHGNPELLWRARFLSQSMLIGATISVVMTVMYLTLGNWALMLETGFVLGVMGLGLTVLRLGIDLALITHLALGFLALSFTLGPISERHFDGAALAWFCVIPFLAVLLLGRRAAFVWSLLVLVGMAVLFGQPDDPGPVTDAQRLSSLGRAIGLTLTVFVFAVSFRKAQEDARDRLERANAAKSRFLANMSHELRTPMNGVLGMVDVMLQKPLNPELSEQLEVIRHSGKTMVELINGILDLSKIEAGKMPLEQLPFSLLVLSEDLEHLYRPLAAQRSLAFRVERVGALGDVTGDQHRVRQVLGNLLDNALKFTSAGEVRLTIARLGERVHFEVKDTGPGIAPEVAQRLFTPFEQADSSTTRRFGGSGLGLALSKQLIELMGSELVLQTAPGRGSSFAFELQLPPAAHPPAPEATPKHEGTSRGRVLVVDDNPINLKVACALVKSAGYEVGDATNGRLALERLRTERWDAVVMDCHMPEMDGYEATRQLRAGGSTVPVIALTAAAMADELEACRLAGMNECLTKPVNFGALKRALELAVHGHAAS